MKKKAKKGLGTQGGNGETELATALAPRPPAKGS